MITKDQLIEILKNHFEHALDESFEDYHIYEELITEYEYCWLIPHTNIEYHKSGDLIDLKLGTGPFIIDKTNGSIYLTGSAPNDWVKDFECFKQNKESEFRWKPLRNEHLQIKQNSLNVSFENATNYEVEYSKTNSFLENLFKDTPEHIYIKKYRVTETHSYFLVQNEMTLNNSKITEVLTLERPFEINDIFPGPLFLLQTMSSKLDLKRTSNYWVKISRNRFGNYSTTLYLEVKS
ncbi:MAG: hypothetical protein ACPG6V_09635 [Flavobacteriales bacterium]